MKPLRLEIRNVGPFVGEPVVIDFAALGPLFVVTGATGAGKTTLFDALTYALYGAPLGTREVRTLRAKHAHEDEATVVIFELACRGARYRVARSPHHPRVGRGGRRVIDTYAQLFRAERDAEGEETFVLIAEGPAQVDPRIERDVIGLGLDEFSKLLVLPQGEFQHFLEMSTKARAPFLETLFPTTQHREVTMRAAERARELDARVRALTSRIEALAPSDVEPDFAAREASGVVTLVQATEDALAARAALTQATEARALGLALLDDFAEHDRLGDLVAARAERADALSAQRARVVRARAAQSVLAALVGRDAARTAVAQSAARHDVLAARLVEEGTKREALERERLALEEELRAHEGDEARASALATSSATIAQALARFPDAARARTAGVSSADAEGDAPLPDLDALAEALRDVRQRREALLALASPVARLRALRTTEIAALTETTSRARAAHEGAEQALRALDETRTTLDEALAQAHAATLADTLDEGAPCPVCGSTAHPSKAVHGASEQEIVDRRGTLAKARAQTEADLRARAQALAAAESAAIVAETSAASLEAQLLEAGFASLEGFDRARERIEREHGDRESALAAGVAIARVVMTRLGAEARALTEAGKARRTREAAVREADSACAGRVAELGQAITRERGSLEDARAALVTSEATAGEARAGAGFADDAAVHAVALPDATLGAIEREIAAYDAEGATLEGRTAAVLARIGARERPSREQLLGDEADATLRVETTSLAARQADDALRALQAAETERRALGEERATVEAEGDAMRTLARDLAGDNALKLDFATYALTLWLDDVLDRASDRFAKLTDGRYAFVRSEEPGSKQRRAGLEIDVHDAQSDDTRSVRTLSGGEKFLAALALALGLADTVRARAGGIELDVLLIDEGFGHLDADALARVLAVLEDLGAGRQVGLVSHVEALAREIPWQVRVVADVEGSRVEVFP